MSFALPTHQKSSRRLLREVCHPYTALLSRNTNVSLKTRKKQGKERETDCFQQIISLEHEDEDENKVPDLSQTKLVLISVLVLGSKALYS